MARTEKQERAATSKQLDVITKYLRPGTNEGISFEISRLTDDLFTDSFLGGGDISLFTPSGKRGTVKSQLSNAFQLDPSAGPPKSFPIEVRFDLNTGKVKVSFTLPGGSAQSGTFHVEFLKKVRRPEGPNILFTCEGPTDKAAWALSLILL
jgi:hypothetical protein